MQNPRLVPLSFQVRIKRPEEDYGATRYWLW